MTDFNKESFLFGLKNKNEIDIIRKYLNQFENVKVTYDTFITIIEENGMEEAQRIIKNLATRISAVPIMISLKILRGKLDDEDDLMLFL